ncbi:NAC transcription factor 32-like [Macadamia integrifolia]|uniref:NAC transcription factor 32-like n=1 Tax=Macadamia integrifolia TaxID=60698 RepID=UPI001C4ECE51|nr:NAC transcription factor 32-like [Macadamia integrifolia]
MASAMVSHEGNFDVLDISRRSEKEGLSRAMMEIQRRRSEEKEREKEEMSHAEISEEDEWMSDAMMGDGNEENKRNIDLMKIPTGFRFAPTDLEFVKYYLTPKVLGKPLPPNNIDHMDETELYSKPPDDLDFGSWDGKECFFFTRQDGSSYDGLVSIHIVGNGIGFWKFIGKEKFYCNCHGNKFAKFAKFAFKSRWTYYNGTPQKRRKTKWFMTQYQFQMKDEKDEDKDDSEWVVGRMKKGSNYRSLFQ